LRISDYKLFDVEEYDKALEEGSFLKLKDFIAHKTVEALRASIDDMFIKEASMQKISGRDDVQLISALVEKGPKVF
jgi:hypothetical protein